MLLMHALPILVLIENWMRSTFFAYVLKFDLFFTQFSVETDKDSFPQKIKT